MEGGEWPEGVRRSRPHKAGKEAHTPAQPHPDSQAIADPTLGKQLAPPRLSHPSHFLVLLITEPRGEEGRAF